MTNDKLKKITYLDAGVNIEAGDTLVENIKPFSKDTMRPGVLAGIGGFGAMFEIPKGYDQPVLVSGTDGVGTKLRLAFALDKHDTIGVDLVAMSVNDILVQGAEPLFFLDYFACGKLDINIASRVIKGITDGCKIAGCSLIGGETAEMPGMYADNEYDLAGFAVGVVEKSKIIDGSKIKIGDMVLGLASSGFHSNGYSLIRTIIKNHQLDLTNFRLGNKLLSELIMTPTKIYVKSIMHVLNKYPSYINGMSHITGGGLIGNLPRILPKSNFGIKLTRSAWIQPDLFNFFQKQGDIEEYEMYKVFNCGIGMALIVSENKAQDIAETLTNSGETVMLIGKIVRKNSNESVIFD